MTTTQKITLAISIPLLLWALKQRGRNRTSKSRLIPLMS